MVDSIYLEGKIIFTVDTDLYECDHSPSIDSHHKHDIKCDLRI